MEKKDYSNLVEMVHLMVKHLDSGRPIKFKPQSQHHTLLRVLLQSVGVSIESTKPKEN